jgi:D-alanine-D-alanine ligase
MRVGITYDLRDDSASEAYDDIDRAEFDELGTIQAIERVLRSFGHATDRIGHARALMQRLAQGERWDLVFNIAEGVHGFGRQALVPALLEAYRIPYTFSDPLALSVALHKPTAKRVIRDHGIATPDFAVMERLVDADGVKLPFPLFVKPVAEGTSKGVTEASRVFDHATLHQITERLLMRFRQPVLVETFLPGREFTVGILGTGPAARALGVMEVEVRDKPVQGIYSYDNKKHYEQRMRFLIASDATSAEAEDVALKAWVALGCRDAGRVDLRCDAEGRVHFIEANPLAGLNPHESDLVIIARLNGMSYEGLIARIVVSALRRGEPQEP